MMVNEAPEQNEFAQMLRDITRDESGEFMPDGAGAPVCCGTVRDAAQTVQQWADLQELTADRLAEAEAEIELLRHDRDVLRQTLANYGDRSKMGPILRRSLEMYDGQRAVLPDTASAGEVTRWHHTSDMAMVEDQGDPLGEVEDAEEVGARAGDVRRRALEEAADVAAATQTFDWQGGEDWAAGYVDGKNAAAKRIRALIATPPQPAPTVQEAARVLDHLLSTKPEDAPLSVSDIQGLWRITAERKGFDAVRTFLRALSQQEEGGENG